MRRLIALFRWATYRTPARPHPHANAGITTLTHRRPHDELETWR